MTDGPGDLLEFLRRRLAGDYEIDEFGFDADLTDTVLLPMLRPLYRRWFRIEVSGIEHVPAVGPALVVANHSGTVAMDAVMTTVALHDEHPAHRHLRMLGGDLVFRAPVIGELARKGGSTLACAEDVERLLAAGELVGVWPEGYKGTGKLFRQRGAAGRRTHHPVLDRRRRGDLPDPGQRQSPRPAARPAVLPADADVPVARAVGRGPTAVEMADRVRPADPDPGPGCRGGRRSDAGVQPDRPGSGNHSADAVSAAPAA